MNRHLNHGFSVSASTLDVPALRWIRAAEIGVCRPILSCYISPALLGGRGGLNPVPEMLPELFTSVGYQPNPGRHS